jgi:hypothetical protein
MWKDLETDITSIEVLHNNVSQAVNHKTDANQLLKFKNMLMK